MADDDIIENDAPATPAPAPGGEAPKAPLTPVSGDSSEPDDFDESSSNDGADEDEPSDSLIGDLGDDDDAPADDGAPTAGKPDASLSVVPKTADGYQVPKIAGLELTDADKPALQGFMNHAHKIGAPQSAINAGLSFFAEIKAAQTKLDVSTANETKNALLSELGEEGFKTEKGRIQNALRSMPGDLGKQILNARLPDGRKLINDPNFFRWMSNQNAKTRVPTTKDRLKEIQEVMKRDIDEYYRLGLSDEYAELIAKQEGGQ